MSQELLKTNDDNKDNDSSVFTVVEQSPIFPGGDEARIKFLSDNIVYPKRAKRKGIV
jgi:periplasmic protein TonB